MMVKKLKKKKKDLRRKMRGFITHFTDR